MPTIPFTQNIVQTRGLIQAPAMTSNHIVFTDLDNTLFNWIDYFAPCFRAMLHALSWRTKQPEEVLYDQFRTVYMRSESVEFTRAIQQLELCRTLDRVEVDKLVHIGRVAFGRTLRARLQPYPDVPETLAWLNTQRVAVVGVTNSYVGHALYRLRRLGLERYIVGLVGWDGDVANSNVTLSTPKRENWRSRTTIRHIVSLPDWHLKPAATAYKSLLYLLADDVGPNKLWVIGDSISKDLVPGREIGAATVWAKYGHNVDRRNWETLLRITHWSRDKIETVYDTTALKPDFEVERFSALRDIISPTQRQLFT